MQINEIRWIVIIIYLLLFICGLQFFSSLEIFELSLSLSKSMHR